MKKIIRSLFIPIVISVLVGYVLGTYFYKTYQGNIYGDLKSSKIYLIENGEYQTLDMMREENIGNNYIYYEDDNKYKTVIGITRNYHNIDKIKSLYNDSLKVMEYYIAREFLDDKQEEYDELLSNANNQYEIKEVLDNILKLYQNDNSIRLIAFN